MKKIIKENYKFIISLVLIFLILNIRFPYYIDAPGGITDISKKVQIDGYKSTGTFNFSSLSSNISLLLKILYIAILKQG